MGCASWLDRSLLKEGNFYPRAGMTAEQRLRWYSRFFSFVEVNATFYAPPTLQNASLWSERTPADFVFGVKAWSPMTAHSIEPKLLPAAYNRFFSGPIRLDRRGQIEYSRFPKEALEFAFESFRASLLPLVRSGKLGYVLFQFSPRFRYGQPSLDYLASLTQKLPGWPLAVEFRHASWIPEHTRETLAFLADHDLAHVAVDAPWMPLVNVGVGSVFVLRCHGRHVAGWEAQKRGERPTVAEKYNYLYTELELTELTRLVLNRESASRRKFIVFNNNRGDYPVMNALQTIRLLGGRPRDPDKLKREWNGKRTGQESFSFFSDPGVLRFENGRAAGRLRARSETGKP